MLSILRKILKFLLGYGDTGGGSSRPGNAVQRCLYKWVLSHPVLAYKAYNLFLSPFKSEVAEVQGHKMHLDRGDNMGLSIFGVVEPVMTKVVGGEVKKGDVVLDIGASIGYYTLIFARLAGENGKVFAFEPAPEMAALLRKNVSENGYKNVTIEQKAGSDKNGKASLYLCGDNNMAHTLCAMHDGRRSVEIETIRLDDYFPAHAGGIDFLKIDVEGAECAALEGLSGVLERNRNIKIVTEFHPKWLKMFGTDPGDYLALLTRHGFKLYNINEKTGNTEAVTAGELLSEYGPEKRTWTNLLCRRQG